MDVYIRKARAGEAAARVAHHCEEAALLVHALVLSPSVHHRAIVDAVDDHLVDAELLEVLCGRNVARHLPRRVPAAGCAARVCGAKLMEPAIKQRHYYYTRAVTV